MKFNKYSIMAVVAVAGLAFSACSDDDDFQPGEVSNGVYFPNTDATSLTLPYNQTAFQTQVCRTGITAAATYQLTATTTFDDGIFTFPTSVSFAEGEEVATLTIPCVLPQLDDDATGTIRLTLGNDVPVCVYGKNSLSITTKIKAVPPAFYANGGIIADGWCTAAYKWTGTDGSTYTYEDFPWAVPVYVNPKNPTVYIFDNPWAQPDCILAFQEINLNYNVETEKPYEAAELRVDATDPDFVMIPAQWGGCVMDLTGVGELGEEEMWVCDPGWFFLQDERYDKDFISSRGYNTVMDADGYIEVVVGLWGPSAEEIGYNWNGDPYCLLWIGDPSENEEAPALRNIKMQNNMRARYAAGKLIRQALPFRL